MRRTSNDGYAVSHKCSGHFYRDRKIGSAVIDGWQDVTMQVDHGWKR
jgi:hypothetical protein